MTDTQNTPVVTVKKIAATEWQHTRGDAKVPSRYAVLVDGEKIGEVASHSEESWATSGRIRTRMLGYRRCWLGALEGNRSKSMLSYRSADAWRTGRADCITELVKVWQAAQAAK